jgi:hypothetical protein
MVWIVYPLVFLYSSNHISPDVIISLHMFFLQARWIAKGVYYSDSCFTYEWKFYIACMLSLLHLNNMSSLT